MGIDIYAIKPSPPCRAAFLVAKAIGLDYNLKIVSLEKGENRTPEFLKMNPAHTVPVMTDGELSIGDSKAIITYMMNQYAPANLQSLYPRDPAARALVDQRLYFDSQLFSTLRGIVFPLLYLKDLKQSQANMPRLEENMALLETFLTRSTYLAGEHLTIADLATLANVSSMEACGIDMSRWPHVQAWLAKLKAELPYYEQANGEGAQMLGAIYQRILKDLGGK
ncbi:glutathione S-transferase 1-like [Amphibalanus amphitrite]|uniref:glutathione S-transferase 1-like n=1 Tax=Amphibalanus amphitrite TaxID=1232801 RepID=UPI001C923C8E|nr:glutathione S-transferase 1-like [Amphibalanus amphitrite]XP_043217120.1 glutathione S-transferase 1-like [Amphibalanus amphitrite]XP_043217121.1 glutathione S-transferase 1-like [Amphibalanus amphitrite]XP_043217122.1 glutathione S-transferase 1-like [Amphibalanus amphitrite]XP_043217123.1 glutathione S-transferase 1-like [Amphibalanus amphitrite]